MMQAGADTTGMVGGAGDDVLIADTTPVQMSGGEGADTLSRARSTAASSSTISNTAWTGWTCRFWG